MALAMVSFMSFGMEKLPLLCLPFKGRRGCVGAGFVFPAFQEQPFPPQEAMVATPFYRQNAQIARPVLAVRPVLAAKPAFPTGRAQRAGAGKPPLSASFPIQGYLVDGFIQRVVPTQHLRKGLGVRLFVALPQRVLEEAEDALVHHRRVVAQIQVDDLKFVKLEDTLLDHQVALEGSDGWN